MPAHRWAESARTRVPDPAARGALDPRPAQPPRPVRARTATRHEPSASTAETAACAAARVRLGPALKRPVPTRDPITERCAHSTTRASAVTRVQPVSASRSRSGPCPRGSGPARAARRRRRRTPQPARWSAPSARTRTISRAPARAPVGTARPEAAPRDGAAHEGTAPSHSVASLMWRSQDRERPRRARPPPSDA
jgi:hypothetical protein